MSMLINMTESDLLSLLNKVHDKIESPEWALRHLKSVGPQRERPEQSATMTDEARIPRAQHVDSTSDDRTRNNTMRHEYRVLSEAEKIQLSKLKDLGLEFMLYLHSVGGTSPDSGRQKTRELSVAQTKIEEAVMWAVKHVTR